ncbi:hypothetical protein [Cryptosporangium phraense]|uniref:Uncharacterized protein n=1 Tax=Cryptosporangium phraense TaxID=2593070 RepID=A0A545AXI8_9ACTN|nr:hypothetical protein [Cryptosporangium phraense]TQS46049.1 hypothetical protein FL583_06055 [Cryptosporangium phraense]
MRDAELPLNGRVTQGVVRVGNTVRRPAGPWTDAVDALLLHLESVGFRGAPRALGRDEQSMAGLRPDRPPVVAAERLAALVDGYGLGTADRGLLVPMLARRTRAMVDLLLDGAERDIRPWAQIWTEDSPYWTATTDYLDEHTDVWARALL